MNIFNRNLLAIVVGLCFFICCSNPANTEQDVEQAKKSATVALLKQHTESISNDSCQGRKPFSYGADLAMMYIATQMKEIGLTPINGNYDKNNLQPADYLQEVKLVLCETTPSKHMQIKTEGSPIRNLLKNVDFTAFNIGRTEDVVEIKEADLVFAGYGIVAPEYGKNDYAGIENPQDKIAVVMVNDPGLGSADSKYFTGDAMTYYGRWSYKYEEGARHGFKGVLIIHETRGAGYPWSVVEAGAHSKMFVEEENTTGTQFVCPLTGWLQYDKASQLFTDNGYNMETLIEQAKKPNFKPIPLRSKLSIKMENKFERKSSYNVIGYVPGSEDGANASVVYTAHWDHLGYGLPIEGDSIINGASDNATGVAWLLETARCFKALKNKPAKNIVFISPTCEETGFLGTEYYVTHPLFPIEKTAAVINLDVIPLWGENNDVTITGYGHFPAMDSLVGVFAAKYNRYVMPDPESYNGMFFRSDHFPFVKRGVPAIFAKGWNDNRKHGKEWSAAKVKDYWTRIYHKPLDQTHPETDDYSGAMQEVYLFFDLGVSLGQK
ncbi:MAG: M28 family peptidase [Bacteroidales bacterium]